MASEDVKQDMIGLDWTVSLTSSSSWGSEDIKPHISLGVWGHQVKPHISLGVWGHQVKPHIIISLGLWGHLSPTKSSVWGAEDIIIAEAPQNRQPGALRTLSPTSSSAHRRPLSPTDCVPALCVETRSGRLSCFLAGACTSAWWFCCWRACWSSYFPTA